MKHLWNAQSIWSHGSGVSAVNMSKTTTIGTNTRNDLMKLPILINIDFQSISYLFQPSPGSYETSLKCAIDLESWFRSECCQHVENHHYRHKYTKWPNEATHSDKYRLPEHFIFVSTITRVIWNISEMRNRFGVMVQEWVLSTCRKPPL